MEYAHARYRGLPPVDRDREHAAPEKGQQQQHHQQQSQQRFRFERDRDKERDRDRDRRPSSPPQPNGTPSTAASRATWRKEEKERAIASALYMAPKIGNGWPSSEPGKDTPAHPSMTVQNQRSRRSPPPALAPSAYGRDRPTFGNGHRPEGRDDAGPPMHHHGYQNGNRRMNGRPRSLSPPFLGARRGHRFGGGPGPSATDDDMLPYDEPQSSYSRQGTQHLNPSPRNHGGRPHDHGGPPHSRQPPFHPHKPDFQQRGWEASNDRERGLPSQYTDSDRERSMLPRPSYYENGGPPPSAFGKRARYDPEAFGKRGPSVDNGWAGARARGGARRRNGSPFSSVSEDGRRSRQVSGPTQFPAETEDGRHSERAVSPDRLSNSTSARSRGRRSPSPPQDPPIPPLRSPASIAGSSHSQSRSESDRQAGGLTSEREQLSLSARISGFPARTGPNGAGQHEDRFSAPPQTAHYAAFSGPRPGNRRDRPPLGRDRDELASRDSSPRSARSTSISQSPRLPHVLSQSVNGTNGRMAWGNVESRPRRASASPPRAPLSARQVASDFQSPRSLRDRLGPPADQTQMSTEQVAPALQRLEAEADQPEREEGEMRSEMEDDAMDEELGLTPPPRIPPSKLRPLAPPVKIEPELELEGQSGQLSAAVSKPMEAPQSSTLPESSAVGRQRRSGTPPGKSLRGMGPPASPRAPGPAPLASSAKTDQCSIHAAPSPLDCKVQPEIASPEAMRSPIKQEATALLSPKQENDRPNGQADAPLGSPSTASTTSPPPAVMRSAPTPARAPRTASQLEPLRAPAPLRQAMTPAVSDPSAGLPEKQDIDGIERSVASSSPPAQGVETANTSHDSTVVGLSMSMDGQKGPTSEGPSPAALEQRDDVEFAMTSEQVSVDEPLRAEEDGMQVEEDFDRTLLSIIELEDSRDDMELDPVDIIDDNRYRLGLTLPLAVPTVDDREGRFSVADPELGNYNLLEPFLHRSMEERDIRRGIRIVRLQQQYRELETEWRAHCKHLEKIQTRQKRRLAAAAPPLTPSIDASGLPFITTPATPSILAPSGRANRRAANTLGYSDAARSEAEFLEILARLEDADMADPNLRAMRTTATVPDMVIDAGERDLSSLQIYQDENGLVRDPLEHYGINKSPDNWTEDEIAIFCRRYALYPKQFGKIGAALPDKTTPQCVLFYYRSKKKIDFRALVDKRSRDGKRKKGKRGAGDKGADDAAAGQQKKGPSLLGNLKRSRVQEEEEEDEEDEPQTPGSAIAQESAVLSTAKALTRQLHGVIAPTDEPSDASGMALLSDALDSATPSAARLMPSRQPSYAKKAARFLSPPAAIDGGDESLVPASDGALAAAEALEVLANGLLDLGSAPAVGSAQGKTATTARQKKRKPSISDSAAMAAGSLVEEVASRPSTGTMGKRARPSTSSYWSVADKNEFTRLLRLHGKNFNGISEGLGSKTTIQCKNFFQNNAKKLGLFEIAAAVDGEDQGLTRASEVLIEELEMPSAFATPEESATSSHDQHPTAGYFVPVLEEEGHGEQYSLSGQKQGGMHLRHLLDDAPDAEGGATHPKPDLPYQKLASRPRVEDYDSSTEDEADLAGRLQQARRESATGSDLGAAEQPRAEDQLHHAHHQPPRTNGVSQQAGSYYNRTIYDDSNHSPDYTSRDQISPAYPTPLANERNFSGPLPPLKGRYAAFPPPRQWSPYDSRTIYSQATPSISSFYRSTSVGAMPAGAAPHMVSQAHEADYGDESRHFSPPPRTSFYRGQVAATEAEHENGRGLPPLVSASAKGTASHYSPYYEAVATPPLYGPPSSSLRQSEGPENYADSSRRYDHYSAYRGQ